MRRIVGIGLFLLLVYHSLGYVLIFISAQWQEQHDLSEHLLVYRSVDSLVEFQIPLRDKAKANELADATTDGFGYRGHYYDIVSMHIQQDTLLITGLETNSQSFWQNDLLTFLHNHLAHSDTANHKASQLLKFLLKEYPLTPQLVFRSLRFDRRDEQSLPAPVFVLASRPLPVHSPPPEWRCA